MNEKITPPYIPPDKDMIDVKKAIKALNKAPKVSKQMKKVFSNKWFIYTKYFNYYNN